MLLLILIMFIIYFFLLIFRFKIHFDWKSLFKAGFSKKDDKFGLYTYCGAQGEGKTYSAVRMAINLKNTDDYIIITNLKSFNAFTDTIYECDILKIINMVINETDKSINNRCKYLILFDEIFTVLLRNVKNAEYLVTITNFLAQLRKRGIIFITTAQNWSEIPIEFRKLCRFQVNCKMINVPIFNKAFTINQICDGYNAKWDDSVQDHVAPIIQTNIAKGLLSIIECYDTFETISTIYNKKKLPLSCHSNNLGTKNYV